MTQVTDEHMVDLQAFVRLQFCETYSVEFLCMADAEHFVSSFDTTIAAFHRYVAPSVFWPPDDGSTFIGEVDDEPDEGDADVSSESDADELEPEQESATDDDEEVAAGHEFCFWRAHKHASPNLAEPK